MTVKSGADLHKDRRTNPRQGTAGRQEKTEHPKGMQAGQDLYKPSGGNIPFREPNDWAKK